MLADELPERTAVLARRQRRTADVALMIDQQLLDVGTLELLDRPRLGALERLTRRHRRAVIVQLDVVRRQHGTLREEYRTFDDVFELTHIAGPGVVRHSLERRRGDPFDLAVPVLRAL